MAHGGAVPRRVPRSGYVTTRVCRILDHRYFLTRTARHIIGKPSKPLPRQVRIIGGQYRRTPLAVVDDVQGLRPTPDRVRETLYNWLTHLWQDDYSERHVLDLFAGTGALGFEAASRGAGRVVLVETDRRSLAQLEQVRRKLKADQVRVVSEDALAYLARSAGTERYDLILLDPPFGRDWLARVWPLLEGVLAPRGLVYAEAESELAPSGFVTVRQAKAGAVHYHLLEKAGTSEG